MYKRLGASALLMASAWLLLCLSGCRGDAAVVSGMALISSGQEEAVQPQPSPTPEVTPTPEPTPEIREIVDPMVGEISPSGHSYAYYDLVEPTYIDGILLVNKDYPLPRDYVDQGAEEAQRALAALQWGASQAGYALPLLSAYRSFESQDKLYTSYANQDGAEVADTYSAWPGHSEHQTGLAFDVGRISAAFGDTEAGQWLAAHAHEYGFIIRYPADKTEITGYQYEPWHIRYLGEKVAQAVYDSGLCLEEYLGVAE